MAMGDGGGKVTVFDALRNQNEAKIFEAQWHQGYVFSLAKLNSDTVISGCNSNLVVIWNWKSQQKIKEIKMNAGIFSKAILKLDEQKVAIGFDNGEIVVLK